MHILDLISIIVVGALTLAWLVYTWKKPAHKKSGLCGTCPSNGQCSMKSFAAHKGKKGKC